MKIKKGGVESIVAAVVLVGIVIGLIFVVVKNVSDSAENAARQGVDNLAGKQPTMQ